MILAEELVRERDEYEVVEKKGREEFEKCKSELDMMKSMIAEFEF